MSTILTLPNGLKHCPALARYARTLGYKDITGAPATYTGLLMNNFLNGRTEGERFEATRQLFMLTWPHLFLHDMLVGKKGEVTPVGSTAFNPWLERILQGFVNEKYAVRQGDSVFRFVGLTGVGAAGKTFGTGYFSFLWWAMMPSESMVILTSTSKKMIRSRVWSNIHNAWDTSQYLELGQEWKPGHMVDSEMVLKASKGDAKHAISAFAVAQGETLKAIDNLKGMHAPRMLVVVDECNGTPEAILQVIGNYRNACRDLTVVAIGNPSQRLDPHGRLCKPIEGWPLAADDTNIEWRTEGAPEWNIDPGLCLRFDGRDSPNVRAKQNFYPHIFSWDDWRNAQAMFELHGGTFNHWTQKRGLWPADGTANTIFTEQLFVRCEAMDQHHSFVSQREPYCFVDTAFGGDACIMQFGEVGDIAGGRKALQLTEWLEVPIDPASHQHDRDYQIARYIIEACKVRHVKPHNCGLDATGTGRGVAAIVAAEWSSSVHYVVWSQGCTDRPSSQADGRPAREVYATFVTESWFSLREGMEAGQVKGFGREAVQQLCARFFEQDGRKYKLETKADMRERLRYSPDHADAVVGLWEIARRNGVALEGKIATTTSNEWLASVKEQQVEGALDMDMVAVAAEGGGWATDDTSADRVGIVSYD